MENGSAAKKLTQNLATALEECISTISAPLSENTAPPTITPLDDIEAGIRRFAAAVSETENFITHQELLAPQDENRELLLDIKNLETELLKQDTLLADQRKLLLKWRSKLAEDASAQ
eukprot:m.30963 g.30963  ORF g.30963 m.30963 type:complete len:117 (+) comp13908_c0_seq2:70-420(+)